jgi:phosphoglycolate phosphatase
MIRNLTGRNGIYDTVFFDLDGTITDSGEGCMNAVRYMFEQIGYPENMESRLRDFVGPPLRNHLMKEYCFSESEAEKAYALYREYYLNKGIYENRVYDGFPEALASIKRSGKRVYIATSKPEPQALFVLERFGLLGEFTGVFAADHKLGICYKDEVIAHAVKTLGKLDSAVMVGDRSYDILGGKLAGFGTVGVLYGYGGYDELSGAGCDYIVDSTEDLSALLGES